MRCCKFLQDFSIARPLHSLAYNIDFAIQDTLQLMANTCSDNRIEVIPLCTTGQLFKVKYNICKLLCDQADINLHSAVQIKLSQEKSCQSDLVQTKKIQSADIKCFQKAPNCMWQPYATLKHYNKCETHAYSIQHSTMLSSCHQFALQFRTPHSSCGTLWCRPARGLPSFYDLTS